MFRGQCPLMAEGVLLEEPQGLLGSLKSELYNAREINESSFTFEFLINCGHSLPLAPHKTGIKTIHFTPICV